MLCAAGCGKTSPDSEGAYVTESGVTIPMGEGVEDMDVKNSSLLYNEYPRSSVHRRRRITILRVITRTRSRLALRNFSIDQLLVLKLSVIIFQFIRYYFPIYHLLFFNLSLIIFQFITLFFNLQLLVDALTRGRKSI